MHCLMNESLASYVHLLFVVFDERIRERAEFNQRARAPNRKLWHFSDDSSERLWLAIAFISSTDTCVCVCVCAVIMHNTVKTCKKNHGATLSKSKCNAAVNTFSFIFILFATAVIYFI